MYSHCLPAGRPTKPLYQANKFRIVVLSAFRGKYVHVNWPIISQSSRRVSTMDDGGRRRFRGKCERNPVLNSLLLNRNHVKIPYKWYGRNENAACEMEHLAYTPVYIPAEYYGISTTPRCKKIFLRCAINVGYYCIKRQILKLIPFLAGVYSNRTVTTFIRLNYIQ